MEICQEYINGKRFAITGTLPVLRSEAVEQLTRLGGMYRGSVTGTTEILIVGILRVPSRKLNRALALQKAGSEIILIPGEELFQPCSTAG